MNETQSIGIVTAQVLDKICYILDDLDRSQEMIEFLQTTEPLLLEHGSQFANAFLSKIRFRFHDDCIVDSDGEEADPDELLHDVIVQTLLTGFFIAREASHAMFNDIVDLDSLVDRIISSTKKTD